MGRGENRVEILKFLLILKSKLTRAPKLITVDYAPSWETPIKQVFPRSKIQKCAFHSVQLFTRAILKDLTRFGRIRFTQKVKELNYLSSRLRKRTTPRRLEEYDWTCDLVLKSLPHYKKLRELNIISDFIEFESRFFEFLRKLNEGKNQLDLFLEEEMSTRYPKGGITQKNLKYFKKEMFKAQRRVLRLFRRKIEEKKKQFSELRYVLLTRPERLTLQNEEILKKFLADHPEFQRYRDYF